ncbi:hypothetical protein [Constantimarinum furrinae]|uniref:Glycosyltransferase RgtA/B/C/D-like domain-containing protein n=1 Tax=Constantimarinum furrinae TaxID=2562285 RepID=A0A7G8PV67_9FLAO|nr:hypothetical protein [Constantimarinum furrinae]QNJ98233.1 hypothetical protein ALE3EI_1681 [Constantimarinum furrinae]
MRITTQHSDRAFQILFYGLCVFYLVFYMPFGFEGTDTGYIFGSSWNVYNGEFPHRDFIYTRPAFPAYFHSIFLFISETYGYLLDRSFFYVQVFTYSLLAAKILADHFEIKQKTFLYFIASLGAIVSVHNYPPMGWNTIDGIFFCTLGLYFLLKPKLKPVQVLLGSLFLVLGVFSKQSFYFMPLFLFLYFLLRKDFKKLAWYSATGLCCLLLYLAFKYATGTLEPFFEQTFQRTGAGSLMNVGVKTYYLAVKFNLLYFSIGILLFIAAVKYLPKNIAYALSQLSIAVLFSIVYLNDSDNWSIVPYLLQLLLLITFGFALFKILIHKDRRFLLVILLLCLSWSASISNGYQTPIHFSLPVFFTLYLIVFSAEKRTSELDKLTLQPLTGGIVILAFLVTFYLGYQSIYRDAPRKDLNRDMGEVFPQLTFIKSDTEGFEKYSELKTLAIKYPNFTVIPSMTLAHYLTGTVNPIGTDWPLDVEINDEATLLEQQLKEKNTTILLENAPLTKEQRDGYELIDRIEQNWKLIDRTQFFDIYQPQ